MKQIPNGVKNIIFDLGGVLLDLDVNRSVQAFRKLGLNNLEEQDSWYNRNKFFSAIEVGTQSDEEFRSGVRSILQNEVSDEEIDAAWCAMLVDFAPEKIALLKNLRLNYNLFLFSNTNNIHLNYFRKLFFDSFGFQLDDLFVKTFYSHEIGMRKPDLKSFLYVLQEAGIVAHESLFIDDLDLNIEGAKSLGIQNHLVEARYEFGGCSCEINGVQGNNLKKLSISKT